MLHLSVNDILTPKFLRFGRGLGPQDMGSLPNRRQGIAQLVRQCRQKFILSSIRVAQRLFGSAPLGDVMKYHDGPTDIALLVPDWCGAVLDCDFGAILLYQRRVIG